MTIREGVSLMRAAIGSALSLKRESPSGPSTVAHGTVLLPQHCTPAGCLAQVAATEAATSTTPGIRPETETGTVERIIGRPWPS